MYFHLDNLVFEIVFYKCDKFAQNKLLPLTVSLTTDIILDENGKTNCTIRPNYDAPPAEPGAAEVSLCDFRNYGSALQRTGRGGGGGKFGDVSWLSIVTTTLSIMLLKPSRLSLHIFIGASSRVYCRNI